MVILVEHPLSRPSLPFLGLCVFVVYATATAFYRLFLSPLKKFPGPRLAALTYWFEYYYDLVKGGRFQSRIAKMHERYGPIVRINPHELHIQDIEFYNVLYRRENKLDKFPSQIAMFGIPGSHFATVSHDLHRARRAPLAPYFSKKSVMDMSSVIQEKVEALCRRMSQHQAQVKPMPLGLGFAAMTTDIISRHALGDCYDLLERDDFGVDHHHNVVGFIDSCHFIKHWTSLFFFMQTLPDAVTLWLNPRMKLTMDIINRMQGDIKSIMKGIEDQSYKSKPSVFEGLLTSSLPPQERTLDRLVKEGMALIVAGSETTAQTLSITTYHLLANPDKLAKLRSTLCASMPDPNAPPSLAQLESNPYLVACVQEGLRLAYGTAGRLARVSKEPIKYGAFVIPPGVPVGMDTVSMHNDETAFPDHASFIPERWLEKREDGKRLDKYFTSFGKGTRQCLGINLAYTELYMTIGTIFRRFELELFETTRETVQYGTDYFNAFPEKGRDGVKVTIKS
ncbi:MAG: hypothetical protein Q9185_005608 [Variospora sp. 1 TL-2023]